MIAYRVHQCDTERSGGTLTRVLSKTRSAMHDDLLNALVFLCESAPALHNIDFDTLYDDWLVYIKNDDDGVKRTRKKRKDNGRVVTSDSGSSSVHINTMRKYQDIADKTKFLYNNNFKDLFVQRNDKKEDGQVLVVDD
jgi:hypothetical protein